MRITRPGLIVGAGLLLAALPVLAHHSSKAEYDESQLLTLSGTVTKVSWNNPHVTLMVDVTDQDSKVAHWRMDLASPNGLLRQGWKVDSLKPGDQVAISGYGARDGSHVMDARRVVLGGKALSTVRDDTAALK